MIKDDKWCSWGCSELIMGFSVSSKTKLHKAITFIQDECFYENKIYNYVLFML